MSSFGLQLMRLTFLGTSAAAPTATRNVSGIAFQGDQELLLFDCGEGSQQQMIRFGTGFKLRGIFFSHFHADHYLGVIGLIRTLGMTGREEPLTLYGPSPAADLLKRAVYLGVEKLGFPVHIEEIPDGHVVERPGYTVRAVKTEHGLDARAYVIQEESRPGRFDVERACSLGVQPGPDFSALQEGNSVRTGEHIVTPDQVMGPRRSGRRLVISGDTRPCDAVVEAAHGADLLVHESTFSDEEQGRALETCHSTAREAGMIARRAEAKRLVLTHLSARFEQDTDGLLEQACAEFDGVVEIAHDGLQIDVPRPE